MAESYDLYVYEDRMGAQSGARGRVISQEWCPSTDKQVAQTVVAAHNSAA